MRFMGKTAFCLSEKNQFRKQIHFTIFLLFMQTDANGHAFFFQYNHHFLKKILWSCMTWFSHQATHLLPPSLSRVGHRSEFADGQCRTAVVVVCVPGGRVDFKEPRIQTRGSCCARDVLTGFNCFYRWPINFHAMPGCPGCGQADIFK